MNPGRFPERAALQKELRRVGMDGVFPWFNYVLVHLLFRFRFADLQELIMGEILVWLISLVNWLGTSLHPVAVERVSCQSVRKHPSGTLLLLIHNQ